MRNNHGRSRVVAATMIVPLLAFHAYAAQPSDATPLQDGIAVQDVVPANGAGYPMPSSFIYKVTDPGVMDLTMQLTPTARQVYPRFTVQIMHGRELLFDYVLDTDLGSYLFFPVLERGNYQVFVRGSMAKAPFTLQLRRLKVEVTEQDKTAVLAAIEKGTANLLSTTPSKTNDPLAFAPAIESLVMAALDSDRSGAHQEVIEKEYLPWLKNQFHEVPMVQWNGQTVSGLTRAGSPMYCNAITTLALAEMAPRSPAAKALAEQGANFILAAQLTDRRPAAWRAILKTNPSFGGWRYTANAADADLSVSGWCVIALNACAAADIQPDGMRESLQDAVGFVKKTRTKDGFAYYAGGGGGAATIRDAIGALVFQLYGEHSREWDAAVGSLDHHLFAGTQADDIEDFPLYYAYYATRLHYLRGSDAWEAWRMSAMRQLVKLQRPDGSWGTYHQEVDAGTQRYPTALAILILRMCLNDEPTYMTQEVRGF